MTNLSPTHPILIAGAGPGGLVTALALQQQGFPVCVYESVATLKALGVGINILPHAMRVLAGLGLSEAIAAVAIQTAELIYFNKFGQLIWREARGQDAGYAHPQYSIHRGELQMVLYQAAQTQLGATGVQTGWALESWQEMQEGILVSFRGQDGTLRQVMGACLIAADGFHSAARRKLYPDEGDPLYSGRILWRGVSEAEPFLTGRSMVELGHPNQKFVCYPISPTHAARGSALINWIAKLPVPDWTPPKQDWNRQVDKERFCAAYAHWKFDWLDVPSLIEKAERIYEYPLVDRDPIARWTHGRMTLLGDAAHPMYPIGSNGASQAILDAEAMTNALVNARETNQTVQSAFEAYEAIRRPATERIVWMNRQDGPDQVMQLAEERAPNGFKHVNDVITQSELEQIAARYKQTAGFSLAQVNR